MRTRFAPLALMAGLAFACSKNVETPPPAAKAPAESQPMMAIRARPATTPPQAEAPAAAVSDPRADRITALEKESADAMQAYYAAFDAAMGDNKNPSAEDYKKIQEQVKEPDSKVWLASAQKLLDEDPTDLAAFRTIQWMLDNSNEQASRKTLLALIEKHHMGRPEMGDLCGRLAQDRRDLLEKLVANSPHTDVRGRACYAMADGLKNDIQMAEYIAKAEPANLEAMKADMGAERIAALQTLDTQATQQEIEKIYERVVKDFSDVKVNVGTKRETTLGKQAGGALFEIRTLAVGKSAPEIASADLDKVEFKLSDYRGKVVLLDFWGNW